MRAIRIGLLSGLVFLLLLLPSGVGAAVLDSAVGGGRTPFAGPFSFIARSGSDGGDAQGRIVLHFPLHEPSTQRYRVLCLSVDGSTAVLTGEALHEIRDPAAENRLVTHATLDVADIDQSDGAGPDEVGISFFLEGTFSEGDACQPSNPGNPIQRGNVIVADN